MSELTTPAALLAAINAEHATLLALLPQFTEEQWRAEGRADGWSPHDIIMHLADSGYGMALMVLGEIKPSLPLNAAGWMDADAHNDQRRIKNAGQSRAKAMSRLEASFEHVRRAIETTVDMQAPGPYGPIHTRGFWLQSMVNHAREHRAELEEMLAR